MIIVMWDVMGQGEGNGLFYSVVRKALERRYHCYLLIFSIEFVGIMMRMVMIDVLPSLAHFQQL